MAEAFLLFSTLGRQLSRELQRCKYRKCRAQNVRYASRRNVRTRTNYLPQLPHNFQLPVSYDEHQFENTFHNWITILSSSSSSLVNFSSSLLVQCSRMALCAKLYQAPISKGSHTYVFVYVCVHCTAFVPLLSKCEAVNPHLIYTRS